MDTQELPAGVEMPLDSVGRSVNVTDTPLKDVAEAETGERLQAFWRFAFWGATNGCKPLAMSSTSMVKTGSGYVDVNCVNTGARGPPAESIEYSEDAALAHTDPREERWLQDD